MLLCLRAFLNTRTFGMVPAPPPPFSPNFDGYFIRRKDVLVSQTKGSNSLVNLIVNQDFGKYMIRRGV